MSGTFEGLREPLNYRGVGKMADPCLAAILATAGLGEIEEIHQKLVGLGVSTPEGISDINAGFDIAMNGKEARIDPPRMFSGLEKAIDGTGEQFEKGNGTIIAVKLYEDDYDNQDTHFLLLIGHERDEETDKVTAVYVGDSRYDDVQELHPSDVLDLLDRTIDLLGGIYAYHLSVTPIPEEVS